MFLDNVQSLLDCVKSFAHSRLCLGHKVSSQRPEKSGDSQAERRQNSEQIWVNHGLSFYGQLLEPNGFSPVPRILTAVTLISSQIPLGLM